MTRPKNRIDRNMLARNATIAFVILSATVSWITFVGWSLIGIAAWQWGAAGALFLFFLLVILMMRRLNYRWSAAFFLVSSLVIIFASGYANYILAKSGHRFEAFVGTKLAVIAVALIAPTPAWIGFLVIGLCSFGPLLQYACFPAEVRASFPVQEPWSMILYGIIALFILRHRLRTIALEAKVAKMAADRKVLDDLSKIFLDMRDFTNTPLQSVEITSKLLASGHLTHQQASEYLEKSLVQLRKLSELLTIYDSSVNWADTDSSSDAFKSLQIKLEELGTQTLAHSH